jgi:cysteine synthase A
VAYHGVEMIRRLILLSLLIFLVSGCTKKPQTSDILQAIGNTPLFEIEGIYAKAEMSNPSGSIKDRMVSYLIKKAEERGDLKPGQEIIELTSGNTGVALAMISAIKGYRFTAILPESTDIDKQRIMRVFGADLILTPAKEGFLGAKKKYDEILVERQEAWFPKQFENPDGVEEHQLYLGQEIIRQMNGQVDAFVAGVGTGGTLIGVAKALKKVNPKVKIIAVEPAESPVISGGKPGIHRIEGIGDGFVPKIIIDNQHMIDEIILIKSDDAIRMAKELARKYGLLVGITSGANFLAAKKVSGKYKNVVTVLTDGGERYLDVFFETEK